MELENHGPNLPIYLTGSHPSWSKILRTVTIQNSTTSEKLHFTWTKRRFWFVSIKRPFHASDIEVSVWTPTPTPEDEVWNISEASVTENLPVGAIPHRPFMGEV